MNAENIASETPCPLREMTTRDAEQAYLLNLDPEVIRYTEINRSTHHRNSPAFSGTI